MEHENETTQPADAQKGAEAGDKTPKAFDQAAVDKIVAERVARERAKYQDYDTLKTKAQAYDEESESRKTAEQRAADRTAQLEADLARERATNARLSAAAAHGVPAEFHDLLGTGNPEEIDGRAKSLGELIAKAAKADELETKLAGVGTATTARVQAAGMRSGATPQGTQAPSNGALGAAEAARRFGPAT